MAHRRAAFHSTNTYLHRLNDFALLACWYAAAPAEDIRSSFCRRCSHRFACETVILVAAGDYGWPLSADDTADHLTTNSAGMASLPAHHIRKPTSCYRLTPNTLGDGLKTLHLNVYGWRTLWRTYLKRGSPFFPARTSAAVISRLAFILPPC